MNKVVKAILASLWSRETIRVGLFYAGVIAVIYASVTFFGFTLQTATYAPYGITENGTYQYEGREHINTFNIDLGSFAYGEAGWNQTVANLYRDGELPLWNPYQAAGTPLAGQFSTRALFPYQILQDLATVWGWDFFVLFRFWIAGFFTYLFLRALGIGKTGAILGGLFYMFSGTFTWYFEEQYTNVAMVLPMLLWALERFISSRRTIYFFMTMLSTAFVWLGGNPEVAIYVQLLGGVYVVYRLLTTGGIRWQTVRAFGMVMVAFLLGLGVSAPLILPFQELVAVAFHTHPAGSVIGMMDPTPASWNIAVVIPTFFDVPTPWRILPQNGLWDCLGGYVGILPLFLIIWGLFKKTPFKGLLIFFTVFGVWIVLKNSGVAPFLWIGHLPLLDQAWSQRWAGPAWTFSLAVAGAIAYDAIERNHDPSVPQLDRWPRTRYIIAGAAVLTAVLVALLFSEQAWRFYQELIPGRSYLLIPRSRDYMLAAVQTGIAVTITVVTTAVLLWKAKTTVRGRQYAFLTLAVTALWFYVPRGYNYQFIYLKLVPAAFAIVGVWILSRERWRWAIGILIVAAIVATGIDVVAPYGLPKRQDPFQPAPYVEYLREQGGYSRIMATDGVLMPNLAGALGLYDVRFINSVDIKYYQNYKGHLINLPCQNSSCDLWFTGLPTFSFSSSVIADKLPYYSVLGVRYIVTPLGITVPGLFTVYQEEVNISENPGALPRAFVAHQFENAPSYEAAQEMIGQPDFKWNETVILEEAVPERYRNIAGSGFTEASITDYRANKVIIAVDTDIAGMLVLTDTFFPGWQARIDGQEAKIYRIDGLVRGVFVEPGEHTVEFSYYANSFRQGVSLAVLSLLLTLGIYLVMRRRERRSDAPADASSAEANKNWEWWQ